MKYLITTLLVLASQNLFAADVEIITSKDWSAFKTFSTALNSDVCAASTQLVDQATGAVSELSVMKKLNADGKYSSPFVTVTSTGLVPPYYSGSLKTDKTKAFSLTLWQTSDPGVSLLSRYADLQGIVKALRNDNTVKVDVTGPGQTAGSVQKVTLPFSLSGSSKVITEMDKACL